MMAVYIFVFSLVALSYALPNPNLPYEHQNLDMMSKKFVNSIQAYTKKEQAAKPFIISGSIESAIEDIIRNIPDPLVLGDLIVQETLGDGTSVTVSTHRAIVSGQSSLFVDTMRVSLINPLRPRVTYKFVLPALVLHFDSLHINFNYNGISLNINLSGQVSIVNSSVEGRATVTSLTQRLTDLTTIIQVGDIQSTLVGTMNRLNITSLVTSIVTDIIPQLLTLYANRINETIADLIMRLM